MRPIAMGAPSCKSRLENFTAGKFYKIKLLPVLWNKHSQKIAG